MLVRSRCKHITGWYGQPLFSEESSDGDLAGKPSLDVTVQPRCAGHHSRNNRSGFEMHEHIAAGSHHNCVLAGHGIGERDRPCRRQGTLGTGCLSHVAQDARPLLQTAAEQHRPAGAGPPALVGRGGSSPTKMRPSGLEPPPRLHRTRPSTLISRAIYVRRRPDRPFCPGLRTHRTNSLLSKICHAGRAMGSGPGQARSPARANARRCGAAARTRRRRARTRRAASGRTG